MEDITKVADNTNGDQQQPPLADIVTTEGSNGEAQNTEKPNSETEISAPEVNKEAEAVKESKDDTTALAEAKETSTEGEHSVKQDPAAETEATAGSAGTEQQEVKPAEVAPSSKETSSAETNNTEGKESTKVEIIEAKGGDIKMTETPEESHTMEVEDEQPTAATVDPVSAPIPIEKQIVEQQQLEKLAVQNITGNSSLSLLCQYAGSSDDSESDSDSMDEGQKKLPSSSSSDDDDDVQETKEHVLAESYRYREDPILVSDAETMDTNAVSSDDEEEESTAKAGPLRTKGEILLHELPPIEELTITVPEEECKPIGRIDSIVAQIVLVQSEPGVELLNLETVLFLERGKRTLGKIFDVIGQVNRPIYCVLFNSNQEVLAKNITVGMEVFCAPRTEHTSFIILSELMRMKGSDASWMNDNEPPPNMVEYSDDESERYAKKGHKKGAKAKDPSGQHVQPQQNPQQYQQQYQRSYQQPRGQFRRPTGNYRRNNYPRRPSGYSWHHNLNQSDHHRQPQQTQGSAQQSNNPTMLPNPFASVRQPPPSGPQ
ncbi:H/ACA ribonucleoprotein complex non-core subunit NAF1 [Anopheles aquasalis]|uniref:H/ACA ribonucleoprotein complex non-core subunit NAF1 n=1 Tax=Anopheles aquasalis TaxID=42839 RepID=UPI00215AD565|nr:H/ACA ribonucleoprotein complex non-core subunit NAF1 [Anopheles aquasalis]